MTVLIGGVGGFSGSLHKITALMSMDHTLIHGYISGYYTPRWALMYEYTYCELETQGSR